MRDIKRIFVHCSASPHELGGKYVDVHMIREWHLKRTPPFTDIGYHVVIIKDGTIQQGRPEEQAGAHAKGNNHDSVSVVMVGNDCYTFAQVVSLKAQLKLWMTRYHLNPKDVYCHYQVEHGKTCPNFTIEQLKEIMFRG